MDVNGLDEQFPIVGWRAQERSLLCSRNFGAHDNLVSVLENILNRNLRSGNVFVSSAKICFAPAGPGDWLGAGGISTQVSLRILSRSFGSFLLNEIGRAHV